MSKREVINIIRESLTSQDELDLNSLERTHCPDDDIWMWTGIVVDVETDKKVSNVNLLEHYPVSNLDWCEQ